ncbi:hypothetical protein CEXT_381731 [Caerostris extrusa]|uniref:Uncharacterized protein n=1 Tax=Caerostris extrusa TaxID=172846 RepID=A0AAV4WG93_CAEEX|nr:hypothetical protein CEXT_381731 [Caerostris extrusa]
MRPAVPAVLCKIATSDAPAGKLNPNSETSVRAKRKIMILGRPELASSNSPLKIPFAPPNCMRAPGAFDSRTFVRHFGNSVGCRAPVLHFGE